MLVVSPLFEASVSVSTQTGGSGNNKPVSTQQKQSTNNGQLTSQDVSKIIERNRQGAQTRSVVNVTPSSASQLSQQSANSASNAANRYSQQSNNAGQRQSSLTNGYVTKPTRVPGRVNMNPTFSSRS